MKHGKPKGLLISGSHSLMTPELYVAPDKGDSKIHRVHPPYCVSMREVDSTSYNSIGSNKKSKCKNTSLRAIHASEELKRLTIKAALNLFKRGFKLSDLSRIVLAHELKDTSLSYARGYNFDAETLKYKVKVDWVREHLRR